MTGNYSKQLSKDKMYNILKKCYKDCNISYPQGSDLGTHPATISCISYEDKTDSSKNFEYFVFFYDYDVYFAGAKNIMNSKVMDAIRLEFLEEMVKDFKNTEYPKLLNEFYCDKIKRGEKLLEKPENLLNVNEIYQQKQEIEKEIKQAQEEIKYLNSKIDYKNSCEELTR